MDKCVFIVIRPWSLNILVVTNMVKPETIFCLSMIDINYCAFYSGTLGWFAGRTFKIHSDKPDRLNCYVIFIV